MATRDGRGRWPVSIGAETVERYIREGLKQKDMPARFFEETGEIRQRSAFAAAINRFKVKNPSATPRYTDVLPWTDVPAEHFCYEQRMLRALGARKAGHPNVDAEPGGRLDRWTAEMDRLNLVVMYQPGLGFFKVPRAAGDIGYITVTNLRPVSD